ncbi:MAG: flagellar biosynthetic protein FliO [Phycisphaerales bacterium]|nr:flagellar biosynthetic protein FliO [Phycisphaerales bacterium]
MAGQEGQVGIARRTVVASAIGAIVLAAAAAPATDYGPALPPSAQQTAHQSADQQTDSPASPAQSVELAPQRIDETTKPLGVDDGRTDRAAAGAAGSGWGIRTVLALLAVLSLIFIGATVVRRLAVFGGDLACSLGPGGRAPSGVLSVLGRYPVGGGERLVLLKIDRRVLLLSQSVGRWRSPGSGFRTLCEITDPEEVALILVRTRDEQGDSIASRFRSLLQGEEAGHAEEFAEGRRVEISGEGDITELWDSSQAGRVLAQNERANAMGAERW